MNSNQRGGHGKSWVFPVANLNNIYQTYTNILEMEQTPVDLPRCEARRYMVETIAVNLKLWLHFKTSLEVKEKSEGKGHFFFLPRLQDWQSAQDVNQLQELSRRLHG